MLTVMTILALAGWYYALKIKARLERHHRAATLRILALQREVAQLQHERNEAARWQSEG